MDKNRRTFLKIILIGSGTLIIGKIFGPLFSKSMDSPLLINEPPLKIKEPQFKVIEDQTILSVYDRYGEEIFQIDKEA